MNPKQSDLVYTYYVDAGCQTISVDENWESFARENGGEVLVDNVVGKSLLQFISNPEVCAIYQMLLDQVLTTQNAVTVTLRCDSAELRREMELQVIPLSNSLAKFACYTRLEEPHPFPLPILDPNVSRSEALAHMCSWCKKVNIDNEWVELAEAVTRLEWLQQRLPPQVSHGICASCSAEIMGVLDVKSLA